MEARLFRAVALTVALAASLGASYRTPNFIVTAPSAQIAEQIGQAAEKYRDELAVEWLGKPMPKWSQPCPISVQVGNHLGAGGATSFMFDHGEVFGWQMNIQGPLDRILDSVLPHEVTHTIFACHFRRPLPRWADEGACSTVEFAGERAKQQRMLISFLQTGRGIAFSQMFAMKEYPRDILPLYAQGHSLATFLLAQGGKQKYLEFVGKGMETERWSDTIREYYDYANLGELQNAWLAWVRQGSPALEAREPTTMLASHERPAPAPAPAATASRGGYGAATGQGVPLAGKMVPVEPDRTASAGDSGWVAAGSRSSAGSATASPATGAAAASAEAPVFNSATRPQPVEQARQVILEWQRETANAEAAAAGVSLPGDPPATPTDGRSVYDVRAPRDGVIRR